MTGRSGGIKNPFQDDGDNDVRHAKWKASFICSRYSKSRIQSRSLYNLTVLSGTWRAEPLYVQTKNLSGCDEAVDGEGAEVK